MSKHKLTYYSMQWKEITSAPADELVFLAAAPDAEHPDWAYGTGRLTGEGVHAWWKWDWWFNPTHFAAIIAPDAREVDNLTRARKSAATRKRSHSRERISALAKLASSVSARNRRAKTHCKHGHAFTPENTKMTSRGARGCRTCMNQRDREKRARKHVECTPQTAE